VKKGENSEFKVSGQYSVQEYIQEKIKSDPKNIKAICNCPEDVHPDEWLYEHLRQFIVELGALVVSMEECCNKNTCPKMTAGEGFEFLSACAPGEPQMVSAIDYSCHNINFYVGVLNRNKNFPRPHHGALPKKAIKEMKDVAKRLYRVLAHAYCHHKEIFMEFEKETFLFKRFVMLNKGYQLTKFTPPISG